MFCKDCGKEIEEGREYCVDCEAKANTTEATGTEEVVNDNTTTTSTTATKSTEPKSKMAAGLLGIFLGALGIHNFYLGNTGKALAQLLITVLSCSFLSPVSGIWGLIEGIMILTGSINTDANGVPLKD